MQIKDIMKKDFLSVKEDDLIEKVLDIMRESKINSLPVVNSNGLLAGIVVKADIFRFMIQPGHYDSCPVDWVMSKNVLTISPDSSIKEAAKKLLDNHIVAMPVLDNDKLVGMITIEELLAYYMENDNS
ncbi:MAG: CBS domain-containing protein [Clostridiaceae bacterium]|nr:CBS domain-containing protein [Clostridiaceae bacterium]